MNDIISFKIKIATLVKKFIDFSFCNIMFFKVLPTIGVTEEFEFDHYVPLYPVLD